MNKLVVVIFLLLSSKFFVLNGQNIDSLIKVYDKEKLDTNQLKTLDQIIRYYNQNEPLKALPYSIEALELAENLKIEKFLLNAYNQLGITYYLLSNTNKSIEYFFEVLKIYEQKKDSLNISRLLNNIGISYYNSGAYVKAIEYYENSLQIKLRLKDTLTIWTTYMNIGLSYSAMEENKKALNYFYQGLNSWKSLQQEKNDSYASILGEIGTLYQKMDSLKTAEKFLNESVIYLKKSKNKYRAASIILELAKIARKMGKNRSAESNLHEAIDFINESGAFGILPECYSELSAIEEAKGNFRKALEYKKNELITGDSILKNQNLKEMNQLQEMYLIEKQESETLFLKKELDLSKAINERNEIIIIGTVISLIILISIAIYLIRSIRIRKIVNRKLLEQQNIITEANEELRQQKSAIEDQAKELIDANQQLLELDKFKEGMVGMIVHDLKNPLNTIINSSKEQDTRQAGKQMLNLVLNILDVQKFESTEIRLEAKDFVLLDNLEKALNQVKLLYKKKSIKIEVDIPESMTVRADHELITRVFVNLMTNAIKYTPNNGRIIIEADKAVNEKKIAGFVDIAVIDSGPGIPKEKRDFVFDKFSDVVIKKSGGVRSSGLGLTFCKLAVEAHGGVIYVDSEMGKGTSFRFLLPKGTMNQNLKEIREAEIEEVVEKKMELSLEDKIYLKNFTQKLKKCTVYEFSDIDDILTEIEVKSKAISNWKSELEYALKACNEEKYKKLTNL